MTSELRDDCPAEYNLHRRIFLVGGVMFMGALAVSTHAFAAAVGESSTLPTAKFMKISTLLIDHRLNEEIGARLAVALAHIRPGLEQDIDQILDTAARKNAKIVEEFFPDLPDEKLKETCLAIIAAWYTGVIVDEPGSELFAYELALMYQPTRDVMTIPSYAISGPNGWNASAPPLTDMPKF